MLRGMGLDLLENKAGCCGVAGAFGCEVDHYDVAMRIGENKLLPAVRALPDDALLISDGFSCRFQTEHGAGHWAMHPAEILLMARQLAGRVPERLAECRYREAPPKPEFGKAAALAGGFAISAGLAAWLVARPRA